jgi:hypothetical protein
MGQMKALYYERAMQALEASAEQALEAEHTADGDWIELPVTPVSTVLLRLHNVLMAKGDDYSPADDPLRTLRQGSEALGLDAATGIALRLSDKMARLQNITRKGRASVSTETVYDTALDIAGYAVLLCALIDSERNEEDE